MPVFTEEGKVAEAPSLSYQPNKNAGLKSSPTAKGRRKDPKAVCYSRKVRAVRWQPTVIRSELSDGGPPWKLERL